MSLVTRCPACSTMFKVVADQLRVSQGWVRCGSCSDVFDANAYLQSVFLPVAEVPPQAVCAPDNAAPPASALEESAPRLDSVASTGYWLAKPSAVHTAVEQLGEIALAKSENAPANVDVDSQPADKQSMVSAGNVATSTPEQHLSGNGDGPPNFQNFSFVRTARREAFWQQPRVRLGLGFLAGIFVILLGVQWLVAHKDQVVAAEPRFLPVLQAFCKSFACRVKPLQRIESLLIESVSFVKLDNKRFRLSFVLKNTADIPLELPLLELTLNDVEDKTMLRRVVLPVQFGAMAGALLGAHSDTRGVVNLTLASDESLDSPITAAMVSGYRVLIFYP